MEAPKIGERERERERVCFSHTFLGLQSQKKIFLPSLFPSSLHVCALESSSGRPFRPPLFFLSFVPFLADAFPHGARVVFGLHIVRGKTYKIMVKLHGALEKHLGCIWFETK